MRRYHVSEKTLQRAVKEAARLAGIAKRVGCAWHTAKKYIDTYATVGRAYDDECQKILDLAETKVIEMISEKDGPMIRYYLSTKGKNRGYTLRTELEHSGKGDEGEVVIRVVGGIDP